MKGVFLTFALVFLTLNWSCQSPSSSKNTWESPSKTGVRTWDIQDNSHNRTLTATIWYPVKQDTAARQPESLFKRVPQAVDALIADPSRQYPLIVMSSGYGTGVDSLAWLAETLVANGYMVASIEHEDYKRPVLRGLDFYTRAQDVTLLLDSIFNSSMSKNINPKQIGMVGYSIGGLAAVLLAGAVRPDLQPENLAPPANQALGADISTIGTLLKDVNINGWRQSYRDTRIKAYVLLAPYFAWAFQPDSFKKVATDMLIIVGDSDPSKESAIQYAQDIPGAGFKELDGRIGHYEFLGSLTPQGFEHKKERLPKEAWPTLPLEHRRRFVHEEVSRLTVAFFNHNL